MTFFEMLGGRKAAAFLTGLLAVVGCYIAKGNLSDTFVDAIKYLVSMYLASNVATDVATVVSQKIQANKETAQVVADAAPIVVQTPPGSEPTTQTKPQDVDRKPEVAPFDPSPWDSKIDAVIQHQQFVEQAIQLQDSTIKQILGLIGQK